MIEPPCRTDVYAAVHFFVANRGKMQRFNQMQHER